MTEKIYSVLRSLFRYSKLKDLKAPEVLFKNESVMLKARIEQLTAEEIFIMVINWDKYYKQQFIEDKAQTKQLDADLDKYYKTLN